MDRYHGIDNRVYANRIGVKTNIAQTDTLIVKYFSLIELEYPRERNVLFKILYMGQVFIAELGYLLSHN